MSQDTHGGAPPLAATITPPLTEASVVLAQVAMWFAQNPGGQPALGDRTVSFEVQGSSAAEKMASLSVIGQFLAVRPVFRNQVWFVQRRFGRDGNSITLDAHWTPDHDAAFAALQEQGTGKPVAA